MPEEAEQKPDGVVKEEPTDDHGVGEDLAKPRLRQVRSFYQ